MPDERIHRATSSDGTEIAARVQGSGPPLVLVAGTGDGEGRQSLVPLLGESFTCYSMSLRGRGLSGDAPDHSPERLVEDVLTFVESIGEPVALFGHSRGGALSLCAAADTRRVSAVAAFEPHVPEFYDPVDLSRAQGALETMQAAVGEDRLVDALRTFFECFALVNEDEMAAMSAPEALEPLATIAPVLVRDIDAWQLPRPEGLPQLDRVSVPTILLEGDRTHDYYRRVTRAIAARVTSARTLEMPGLGHLGPLFAPGAVAGELAAFFGAVRATL